METPGLHHVILTVTDPDRSRAFYADVLGFETVDMPGVAGGGFFFVCGGVMFFFFASRAPIPNDRFSEFRVGLDHLAFAAASRDALDALVGKLKQANVPTAGVERFARTGNWYVAFRDPDNVPLEYWLT